VAVWVDGKEVGSVAYKAGQREEVSLKNLETAFTGAGPHQVEVRYAANVKSPLPYTLAADWRTRQAPSDEKCAVRLATVLAQNGRARVGESVRLTATLINQDAAHGQPMTMALLGLPAGLTPQPWQLKQLQERGVFDFYELKDGRLACYFRDLKPGEKVEINLDLKAEVPGVFVAPASVAYLYYTDELKWWVPGVTGHIER
jgi:alpha-2-macroglobulin-like protein